MSFLQKLHRFGAVSMEYLIELCVVFYMMQTVFVMGWNVSIVFEAAYEARNDSNAAFRTWDELWNNEYLQLMHIVLFVSEAVVGVAAGYQIHRWNKNAKTTKRVRMIQQQQQQEQQCILNSNSDLECAVPLLRADAMAENQHSLSINSPTSLRLEMEPVADKKSKNKKKKEWRVSEFTGLSIWLCVIVSSLALWEVLPLSLCGAALACFLVNIWIGDIRVAPQANMKKFSSNNNNKAYELRTSQDTPHGIDYVTCEVRPPSTPCPLPTPPPTPFLPPVPPQPLFMTRNSFHLSPSPSSSSIKIYKYRSDSVTEWMLWMSAILNFMRFIHHSMMVGLTMMMIPLHDTMSLITAFLVGVSFVIFRHYLFYLFREKCKMYYKSLKD